MTKINMLTMCNIKTEYKKIVMQKNKQTNKQKNKLIFLCHTKMKFYLFFDT